MTAIRVVCTIALLGYLALFVVVSRDAKRRDVRAFALFLLSMLVLGLINYYLLKKWEKNRKSQDQD